MYTPPMRSVLKSNYIKNIIKLGAPLLAGNFSNYLLQVADTIMVGRLGTVSLAAVAMAGLYTGVVFTFIWPVSVGVRAITARRFGKQELEQKTNPHSSAYQINTGAVIENGFLVGILMTITSVLFSFSAPFIMRHLISDPEVLPLTLSYIYIIRFGLPLFSLAVVIHGFLGGINRTKNIMISNIGGSFLNIGFNFIFIYGKFGFPAMGIKGAALGTILAIACELIYLSATIIIPREMKKYRLLTFRVINFTLIMDIIKVLLPPAVQNILALSIFLLYESIVGSIGTVYLAATHVVFSVFRINKMIIGSFSNGTAILVGNSLGEGDKDKAVHYMRACQVIAAFFATLIGFSVALFPQPIAGIFTKDPRTLLFAVKALRFFAIFFFIEVLGFSYEIVFTGNGWGNYVLFSEFTTNVFFILGFTFLFVKIMGFGIYWAWGGFALYQIFHALILFIGYLSKRWIHVEVDSADKLPHS